MKYLHLVIFLTLLVSCNRGKEASTLLTADNLERSFVSIVHTKDTTIHTAKGGIITIEAGTFDKDVELEIKEAYTLNDILLAGLTTTSNGELLQSGGMIYINVKDGEELIPNKPIQVSMPTPSVKEGMQVFKGTETDKGINWMPADTLKPAQLNLVAGKVLFNNSCASCHAINKKLTGPPMAGLEKRGPWSLKANIHKYIQNPAAFTPTTPYTKKLQAEYGQIMPSFPQFSESGIDAILAFIKAEEKKSKSDPGAFDNLPRPIRLMPYSKDSANYLLPDSVLRKMNYYDTAQVDSLLLDSTVYEDRMGGEIDTTAAWYQFQMKTLGWYNIDSFIDQANAPECSLNIKVTGVNKEQLVNVYFLIPKRKIVTPGDLEQDGFYYLMGKREVKLYPGDAAIIIAFSEDGGFYVGQTNFIVQKKNQIQVQLKPTTKEKFFEWLKNTKW